MFLLRHPVKLSFVFLFLSFRLSSLYNIYINNINVDINVSAVVVGAC